MMTSIATSGIPWKASALGFWLATKTESAVWVSHRTEWLSVPEVGTVCSRFVPPSHSASSPRQRWYRVMLDMGVSLQKVSGVGLCDNSSTLKHIGLAGYPPLCSPRGFVDLIYPSPLMPSSSQFFPSSISGTVSSFFFVTYLPPCRHFLHVSIPLSTRSFNLLSHVSIYYARRTHKQLNHMSLCGAVQSFTIFHFHPFHLTSSL